MRQRWSRLVGGATLLPEYVAIPVLLLLLWAGICALLNAERQSALTTARNASSALAFAYAENTKRIIAHIDELLLDLRDEQARSDGAVDLITWWSARRVSEEFTPELAVTDANGAIIAGTIPGTEGVISLAGREDFIAQRGANTDALFIGRPKPGLVTGRLQIIFSRKRFDAAGRFAGVFELSIDSSQLSHAYASPDLANGAVILVGDDGIIRARMPTTIIGADISNSLLMRRAAQQPSASFVDTGPYIDEEKVISFHHVSGHKLIVAVSFSYTQVLARYYNARDVDITIGLVVTIAVAVLGTLWVRQRRRLLISRAGLSVTLENISQGIAMLDERGHISVVNQHAMRLLGVIGGAWKLGETELYLGGAPNAAPCVRGHDGALVHEVTRPDGSVIEICSKNLASGGAVFTYTDISAHKRAEISIAQLAYCDMITGLPNRRKLYQDITDAVEGGAQKLCHFSLLDIAIDDFKQVSDAFGHDYANRLLRTVGEWLVALAGPQDIVAHPGADQFAILLPPGAPPDAAEHLAQHIQASFSGPILSDTGLVVLSLSIGIAHFPTDGGDAASVLRSAGIALSHAKAEGRGCTVGFAPDMERALLARLTLQNDLRLALTEQQLTLAFQPQFDAQSLDIVGFEALSRWHHPTLGPISPAQFVRIAEEAGLIEILGEQTLRLACQTAATWSRPVRVGVNLSPIQFRDKNLAAHVAAILHDTGLPPDRLELEVTEGVLIRDEKQAFATLAALRNQGIRLALDDFGTGYSSLSYLRDYQFDTLKIDKSFVRSLAEDANTQAILHTIVVMAQRLGLAVIAEGVETQAQLAILRREGCTELQGFLLGRPMPASQVSDLLQGG